jgi:hypothetical protein
VSEPIIIEPTPLRLDLGSGPRPADGFKGVDIVEGVTDFCVALDTGAPWPWPDNSVEQLRACHFIEHIRAENVCLTIGGDTQDAIFFFFDEAYRIAKPGATFQLQWPALQSTRAFQDPTHRRFIPPETLAYLDKEGRKAMGLEHYNVKCDWVAESVQSTYPAVLNTKAPEVLKTMLSERWNVMIDHVATLRARK